MEYSTVCVLLVLLLLGHGRAHGSSEAGPMDAVLPQQPRRDDDFVRMADVGACDELWSTWPAMQDRAVANGTVLIWKMGTSIGNIMKTFMFVLPLVRFLELGLIIDVERFPAFRTAFEPAFINWDIDPDIFKQTGEETKQGLHTLTFSSGASGTLLLSDAQLELFTLKMGASEPRHAVAKLELYLQRRGNWSRFFRTPGLERAPMCAWNMALRRSLTIMSTMGPYDPWSSSGGSSTKAGSSSYIAWHIRTSDGDTARSFKAAKHRYIFHNQSSAKVCPLYVSTLDASRRMYPPLFAENGDVVPVYVSSNSKSMARNCSEAAEYENISAGFIDMGVDDGDSHTAFSKNPDSVTNAFIDLLYLMDASMIVCTSSSFAGAVTAIKGYVGQRLFVEETVLTSRHMYIFAPKHERTDASVTAGLVR